MGSVLKRDKKHKLKGRVETNNFWMLWWSCLRRRRAGCRWNEAGLEYEDRDCVTPRRRQSSSLSVNRRTRLVRCSWRRRRRAGRRRRWGGLATEYREPCNCSVHCRCCLQYRFAAVRPSCLHDISPAGRQSHELRGSGWPHQLAAWSSVEGFLQACTQAAVSKTDWWPGRHPHGSWRWTKRGRGPPTWSSWQFRRGACVSCRRHRWRTMFPHLQRKQVHLEFHTNNYKMLKNLKISFTINFKMLK